MIRLGEHLRARRDDGNKLLVPYVTAGARDDWLDVVDALVQGGADAVEIGIPFSDPVMDGPVIQDASTQALERGTTPVSVLAELQARSVDAPLAVMTYFNLVFRFGANDFAQRCAASGVSGVILPDLPLDEAGSWLQAAEASGVDPVMLVAPNTSDERMRRICQVARGFVYAVGTLGVTGVRGELAPSASLIGPRVKAVTDTPALIGVGVSTPAQAREAAQTSDGVVIGSAVVRKMLDGAKPREMQQFISEFRQALD